MLLTTVAIIAALGPLVVVQMQLLGGTPTPYNSAGDAMRGAGVRAAVRGGDGRESDARGRQAHEGTSDSGVPVGSDGSDGMGGAVAHPNPSELHASDSRGAAGATEFAGPRDRSAETAPIDGRLRPFYLIGCKKCATTNLWDTLVRHSPHFVPATRKRDTEGGKFRRGELGPNSIGKGEEMIKLGLVDSRLGSPVKEIHYLEDPPEDAAAGQYTTPAYIEGYHAFFPPAELVQAPLPVMTADASPQLLFSASAAIRFRQVWGDDNKLIGSLKLCAVLREPLERTFSEFRMRKQRQTREEFERQTLKQVREIEACKAKYDGDEYPERWWAACLLRDGAGGENIVGAARGELWVWHSLYAEQLRHWYCVVIANGGAGIGGPCPTWDDPALRGVLSPERQSQLLLLPFSKVAEDSLTATDVLLEFVGLPRLSSVAQPKTSTLTTRAPKPKTSLEAVASKGVRKVLHDLFAEENDHLGILIGGSFDWIH